MPVKGTKTYSSLPQTSGSLSNTLVLIAALALIAGAIFVIKSRKNEGQEK